MKIPDTLILCIILANTLTVLSNPGDLKLVPFNNEQHSKDAERIYSTFFHGIASGALSAPNNAQTAQLDDKTVGFITHQDFQKNGKNIRFISFLAIDTPYQGKGYGKACMNHFEDQARQDKIDILQLDRDFDTEEFYTKLGFKPEVQGLIRMFKTLTS